MKNGNRPSLKRGDLAVYPGRGVVRVLNVGNSEICRGPAYVLLSDAGAVKITVPVGNKLLRKLSTPAEALRAVKRRKAGRAEKMDNWHRRMEAIIFRLARFTLMDLAEIVLLVEVAHKNKPVSSKEKEICRRADAFFRAEVEACLGEEKAKEALNGMILKI